MVVAGSHSTHTWLLRDPIVHTHGSVTTDQSEWGFTVMQSATIIEEDSAADIVHINLQRDNGGGSTTQGINLQRDNGGGSTVEPIVYQPSA